MAHADAASGAPPVQLGLPGGDAGDQVQGPADGGEGGAGVRPGRALVIEHDHPAADAPQRLPGDGPRQRLMLGRGEGAAQAHGVGADQRPQGRDPVPAGEAELGIGVIQGQSQVIEAGTVGHEAEAGGKHRRLAAEEHVAVPEVAVRQLPRQARRQPGFAGRNELGQPLGPPGHAPLPPGGAPASDPGRPGPGGGQHGARFDMVGELHRPPRRAGPCLGEQGVHPAQQRPPAGQPRRRVHRPVVADEPVHLDQPVPGPRPPGTAAGQDQRRAGHPGGIEPLPDGLDGLHPWRADRGPAHPHHQLLGAAADQQVQVQAAAQVTAGLAGNRPPGRQHLPQFRGHHGAQAAPPAARVIHTRHPTRGPVDRPVVTDRRHRPAAGPCKIRPTCIRR
jgi:hypothetical protein